MQFEATFKPRARLLKLLGDELIGSPRLAIFELVKNAYDADAHTVEINFNNITDSKRANIEIIDNGSGMDLATLVNVWLQPGAENRKKDETHRTPCGRIPLGEKGVGRFAVHKLSEEIEMYTKVLGGDCFRVSMDWTMLEKVKHIEDIQIDISKVDENCILGEKGTRIILKSLRAEWQKDDLLEILRQVNSIKSPFSFDRLNDESSSKEIAVSCPFDVVLKVPGHEEWLDNAEIYDDVTKHAMHKFEFRIVNGEIEYMYEFSPPRELKSLGIEGRIEHKKHGLVVSKTHLNKTDSPTMPPSLQEKIGDIYGEFYVFALDAKLKQYLQNATILQRYLRLAGGIRVYRDGIRVYNYGEPEDDWLELDAKRLKRMSKGINRSIIIGGINLSAIASKLLVEKTNREGFVKTPLFDVLKLITEGALAVLATEREEDRGRLKVILESDEVSQKMRDPVTEIGQLIEKVTSLGAEPTLIDNIKKIGESVSLMREVMAESGTRNLSIALVYHEFEKFISRVMSTTKSSTVNSLNENRAKMELTIISREATRLNEMMMDLKRITKKGSLKKQNVFGILKYCLKLQEHRFEYHGVTIEAPFKETKEEGFEATFVQGPLIGAINNIIDNSIYWLSAKWPDKKNRNIFIGRTFDFEDDAIVIADNGPGFKLEQETLMNPFITTKPDEESMGLGLYYASTVVNMFGGELRLMRSSDITEVPAEYNGGAAVVIVFKR